MSPRFICTLLILGALATSGCFVDRSGLALPDGSPPVEDAGREDAARTDADVPPPDGGREDALVPPPPDSGPGCSTADEGCAGTVRSYCADDELETQDCATLDARCVVMAGGPICVMNVCTPGTTRCTADGTQREACLDGSAWTGATACSRGCDSTTGACRLQTPCGVDVELTTSGGVYDIDLCGKGADQAHTDACPYDEQSPAGEDVVIRVEVDQARDVRFQARQVSAGETIDPTLYLRSACDEMASELWCREDTAGQDEDFTVRLEAGDWFLVVDRHERAGTSCGTLRVSIAPQPVP